MRPYNIERVQTSNAVRSFAQLPWDFFESARIFEYKESPFEKSSSSSGIVLLV
jgi:hypothetical protein